jgi:hypothetical protein
VSVVRNDQFFVCLCIPGQIEITYVHEPVASTLWAAWQKCAKTHARASVIIKCLPGVIPRTPNGEGSIIYLKKTNFTGVKPGVSEWLILCSKCAKTHLRASGVQKNFLGSLSLAIRGREVENAGEGRAEQGRGGETEGRGGEGKDPASSPSPPPPLIGQVTSQ